MPSSLYLFRSEATWDKNYKLISSYPTVTVLWHWTPCQHHARPYAENGSGVRSAFWTSRIEIVQTGCKVRVINSDKSKSGFILTFLEHPKQEMLIPMIDWLHIVYVYQITTIFHKNVWLLCISKTKSGTVIHIYLITQCLLYALTCPPKQCNIIVLVTR
jgi:hypothetical protein